MTTTNSSGGELTYARRMLILAVCCTSLFIVGLDTTIVNVALPSIQRSLHASVSGLQWTLDAYTLVLASLLMLSGSTADRLGRKRIFQTGLVLFTAGSLLCSVAPNLGLLVVFRMLQAVGGSMLNPVAMGIITNTFTDPKERARAIGIWGGVVGVSLALGPVVGGALVGGIGWRSIFWINIPVGIAAVVLTRKFIPESKAAHARRVDPVGQGLIIVLLASVTGGIIEAPRHGWGSPFILGLLGLAIVALIALIRVETHRVEPLLDMRFFRSAPFSGATVIAVAAFASLGAFLFLNTLYLQDVRGYSALHAGLLTVPMAAMAMIFAPISGRLVGSIGPRTPLVIAGPFLAIGAGLLVRLSPTTSVGYLVVAYAMFGIGFGLVNAPITNTAVSGMPKEQAGVAAAVASTSRQIGSTLGVAVTGSLVAVGAGTGFTQASHAAWAVVTGCGVIVLVIGLVSTGSWAARTADANRALLMPEPQEVAGERRLSPVG